MRYNDVKMLMLMLKEECHAPLPFVFTVMVRPVCCFVSSVDINWLLQLHFGSGSCQIRRWLRFKDMDEGGSLLAPELLGGQVGRVR